MRPKILFDLSEVLIGGLYGIEKVIAEAESVPAAEVTKVIAGQPLWDLCSGSLTEEEFLERIQVEGGWRRLTKPELAKAIRELFRATVEGMPEYLVELSRECDLYLLSDHAREWVADVVTFHPFLKLFKKRFYSYEVGSVKREGLPFRHVLKDLGIKPSEIFFIDDSATNVAKAREQGIEAFVFKDRAGLEPVLSDWIERRKALH